MDPLLFVLDSTIEFIEELKLTGEKLKEASQLLTDLCALRDSIGVDSAKDIEAI